jgi:hypothetical protein
MPTAIAEQVMLDVLSVLDSNDEPIYSNCTLQMGEVALEFKNGRSKVPERHAAEVLRNPNVIIPGYTGLAAPPVPNASAELPEDVRKHPPESPAEREGRISAAEEYLRSQGLPVPARESVSEGASNVSRGEAAALTARIAELEQMVADSVDLPPAGDAVTDVEGPPDAAEGASEPEAPAEIPEGLEAETADGKPRCWARKGDGSQCSNASADGSHACKLKAHQKLVK